MGLMKVKTGVQVEIEFVDEEGSTEKQVFIIVPDKFADYASGFLGESTPLAQTLMGRTVGETVPYHLDTLSSLRILTIRLVEVDSLGEAASQREAEYRKALQDLNKRNAAAFAASFSGKWGDYDPDGVEAWDKDHKPDVS